MTSIVIEDQHGARAPVHKTVLDWKAGVPCTVRDLIAERVRIEYQRVHPEVGDKQLTANEMVYLTGQYLAKDQDDAVRLAHLGFSKRGYIVIADGKQVNSLDEEIRLKPDTTIKFVRLLPLVGG